MPTPPTNTILITPQTAALLTGKTAKTIHNWMEAGAVKGQKTPEPRATSGWVCRVDLFSLAAHIQLNMTHELAACIQQADAGEVAAFTLVGVHFYTDGNHAVAAAWFEAAAKKGDVDAMDLLSWHYLNGVGVEKNAAAGLQWLGKAAEHGLPGAKMKLQHIGFGAGPVMLNGGIALAPTDVRLYQAGRRNTD